VGQRTEEKNMLIMIVEEWGSKDLLYGEGKVDVP